MAKLPEEKHISKEDSGLSIPDGSFSGIAHTTESTKERFHTAMYGSGVLEQREFLSENPRTVRIVLLRHYPYMEDDNYLKYLSLLEMKKRGEKMFPEQLEYFEHLSNKLSVYPNFEDISMCLQNAISQIFSHPRNTCVVCDNDYIDSPDSQQKKRTIITLDSFLKQFPSIGMVFRKNLKESDKNAKFITNQSELSFLLGQTISSLELSIENNIHTIVIISNRSYVDAFNKVGLSMNLSMTESIDFFEKTGYISYDFYRNLKKNTGENGIDVDSLSLDVIPSSREAMEMRIYALKKAQKIQSRSLDGDIKGNKKDAIVDQKIIIKEGSEGINCSLDSIIESKDSYVLPALVGAGKSLWAVSLVKKIILEYPKKRIVFYEGVDWAKKETPEIYDELQKILVDKSDVILVIDAFDEIGSDIKMKQDIMKILQGLVSSNENLKIFITGRPSEFSETDNGELKILALLFDRNEFIERKGGTYKQQIYDLFQNNLADESILNNSLLVFFVCELANNYEQYKNLGISSLESIMNSSEDGDFSRVRLYENIIKLIIAKHEQSKPMSLRRFTQDVQKNNFIFREIFEDLSRLSVGMILNKPYDTILSENNWSQYKQQEFFDTVNILFKKGDDNDYRFIHLSFQEYFFYKYREYCFSRIDDRNTWLDFYTADFDISIVVMDVIGRMYFESLEEDILYLLQSGIDLSSHLCSIVEMAGDNQGELFLNKIIDAHILGVSVDLHSFIRAIGNINTPGSLFLLDRLLYLDSLYEDPAVIEIFCLTVGATMHKDGLGILRKAFELGLFDKYPQTIAYSHSAVDKISDILWFEQYEKKKRQPRLPMNLVTMAFLSIIKSSEFGNTGKLGNKKGPVGNSKSQTYFKKSRILPKNKHRR